MTSVSIGVVAEGKTDFAIMEWSIGRALQQQNIIATFHAIQPTLDRTSGTFGEGGWRQVYQWCLRNSVRARKRYFDGGLFAGDDDIEVDLILVHVDGDIHRAFVDAYPGDAVCPVDPASVPQTPQTTLVFCQQTVLSWLFTERDGEERDACVPAAAILSAEAWLVGGLGYHANPESLENPKQDFARLWLIETQRPVPDDIKKLKRNAVEIGRAISARPANLDFAANTPAFTHAVEVAISHSHP